MESRSSISAPFKFTKRRTLRATCFTRTRSTTAPAPSSRGSIRVDPAAHQTDAYQKVRNLLLSDDAEANSAPGLEIEANDVRCTHGATNGQIEAEELFYLQSRGISKSAAQRLIVFGFIQEVIDRLGNEAIASRLGELVQAKFEGSRQRRCRDNLPAIASSVDCTRELRCENSGGREEIAAMIEHPI